MMEMKYWFILCTIGFCVASAYAEGTPSTPGKKLCQFNIGKQSHAPLIVPITLEGKTYRFLIDTGATMTLFHETLRPLLGKPRLFKTKIGGKDQVSRIYYAPEAKMGKIELLYGGLVLCMDLTAVREALGVEIDGVIGTRLLSPYVMQIDPDAGLLTFYESTEGERQEWGDRVRLIGDELGRVMLPVFLPQSEGKRNDQPNVTALLLDTGFFETAQFAEEIFDHFAKDQPKFTTPVMMMIDDGAGVAETPAMRGLSFQTAGKNSRAMGYEQLIVSKARRGNRLGLPWIRRHVTTIDFLNTCMYLKKAKAFAAPDEIDMSGLTLSGTTDGITVTHVAAKSAGAKAGIKIGDVILKVSGQRIKAAHLPSLRNLLRSKTDAKYEIVFRRGKKGFKTTIQLKRRV
jgi:hypothetical protein